MNAPLVLVLTVVLAVHSLIPDASAAVRLGRGGQTDYVILRENGAPEPEANAARELARHLKSIVGPEFPILAPGEETPRKAIIVGSGRTARRLFPDVPWITLGGEEIVLRTKGNLLLVAGGRPRGTLYAVNRFLQDYCGVRWWTPWATDIPDDPDLRIPRLKVQARPAFESRDPFWYPALDREWAVRNYSNSSHAHIPAEWGGDISHPQQHHVRGVFEQGAYPSYDAGMAELRAWVLAQWLWNPKQDDRALIREFIEGYYGEAAAPIVSQYLDLLYKAPEGFKPGSFAKTNSPSHNFATLSAAEDLWQRAETAAATDGSDYVLRVKMARLPLRYVWLSRWEPLRDECRKAGAAWPLPESRKRVADDFAALARGIDGSPWTRITPLNESGLTVDQFVARFAQDPAP